MQGLKKVGKFLQEYIEEFYQVLIRVAHVEENKEKVSCYLTALGRSI